MKSRKKNYQKALKSYKFWCTLTHKHMHTEYKVYMLHMYLYHMHTNVDVHILMYELDSQLTETVTTENVDHRLFGHHFPTFQTTLFLFPKYPFINQQQK